MWSRISYKFPSLEHAIVYCRKYGLAYEISYPKRRYFQVKNYANNFKWKGPPKTEEEDIA